MCSQVPQDSYTLQDAQASYAEMSADIKNLGPMTQKSIWAKAYGIFNCGAAGFEALPSYNDPAHVLHRCIFMNNYGIRTVNEECGMLTWNWNAPFWLGINTINVNGKTNTLIGSMMWGEEVVAAIRDNIEVTLREIMAQAPNDTKLVVPTYTGDSKKVA